MEPTAVLSCVVNIQGMKCQSCVRNIEKKVGDMLGVMSIKVDLEKKEGTVQYDSDLIQPIQVADFIQAMGFTSEIKSTEVFPGKKFCSLLKKIENHLIFNPKRCSRSPKSSPCWSSANKINRKH